MYFAHNCGTVNQAEISIISNEIKACTQRRKNYNTSVPERIKNEVGEYVLTHGTKSALEKFGKNILNIPYKISYKNISK